MTLTELEWEISKASGISASHVKKVIKEFTVQMSKVAKRGDVAILPNFGTFYVANSPARQGRNPRTGAPVSIPAKNRVQFRPSKKLNAAVN